MKNVVFLRIFKSCGQADERTVENGGECLKTRHTSTVSVEFAAKKKEEQITSQKTGKTCEAVSEGESNNFMSA